MPAYFVAQYVVNDLAKYRNYQKGAGPAIEKYGGKLVAFDVAARTIEAKPPAPQTVILEYKDDEALNRWNNSEEYQAVVNGRLEATEGFGVAAQSMNAG